MTIKEIEYRSGLPRASVRYYEAEGLLHPTRAPNGYREYSMEDLNTLLKVKLLRELGCSLEEILALQKNEIPLSQVLQERLEALEGETAELERAKALCIRLRDDRATYESLDPARYLAQERPVELWTPPPAPPKHYPWRRFFARSLDLGLCNAAVRLFLAFVMNTGTLFHESASDGLVVGVFSLLLMVAVEPVLLHFFRTTPGKWVFRLRLSRDDGTPLSYGEALLRTMVVLLLGCGLTLPVLGNIANALGFWRATHDQLQPWESDEELLEDTTPPHKEFSAVRAILLYLLAVVLVSGAQVGGEFWASRLPCPHPETLAEFTRNYNHIMEYACGDDRSDYAKIYPPDGDRLHIGPNPFGDYPDFTYEETEDGRLMAVALDINATSEYPVDYPGTPMACALVALEGTNAYWIFDKPLEERYNALEEGEISALEAAADGDWHASLAYTVSNGMFGPYSQSFGPDGEGTQHVTVRFRLERTAE